MYHFGAIIASFIKALVTPMALLTFGKGTYSPNFYISLDIDRPSVLNRRQGNEIVGGYTGIKGPHRLPCLLALRHASHKLRRLLSGKRAEGQVL